MKLLALLFLTSYLFFACDKQGYKSFTETNEFGEVVGEADPTDWIADADWKSGIEDLIASECELEGIGNSETVAVYPAFPNPATFSTTFAANVEDSCLMRVVIVDKYNTVYSKFCRHLIPGNNLLDLDISSFALAVGGRYRLYYAFLDESDAVFYKGHGDIVHV
ncbi:MAG: hypothetical protein P8I55_00395 [Crocinitomix sp.]|nr:hypothetical protein [Crocinitomix sp.]